MKDKQDDIERDKRWAERDIARRRAVPESSSSAALARIAAALERIAGELETR